jgi:hypothetical protein
MGSDLNVVLDNQDINWHNSPCNIVADIPDLAVRLEICFSNRPQTKMKLKWLNGL